MRSYPKSNTPSSYKSNRMSVSVSLLKLLKDLGRTIWFSFTVKLSIDLGKVYNYHPIFLEKIPPSYTILKLKGMVNLPPQLKYPQRPLREIRKSKINLTLIKIITSHLTLNILVMLQLSQNLEQLKHIFLIKKD